MRSVMLLSGLRIKSVSKLCRLNRGDVIWNVKDNNDHADDAVKTFKIGNACNPMGCTKFYMAIESSLDAQKSYNL